MVEFKLVLGDTKSGKCYQRVVKDAETKPFLGKMIGDKIKGDGFGLAGYEFELTGGSDHCGFPMRRDAIGTARKKILALNSVGIKHLRAGQRVRKNVAGNTVHANTSQINLKILAHGKAKLGEDKGEEKKAE
jgi:small subunit ribosomal protein S6e